MQRYWWPGFDMQLLKELQKQQQNYQFCDTLLETEGFSVPTHSCVLAAFSPYLSQKLSTSPPPPSRQKHQLQLESVKVQTLLKLVGLLYTGELEVKGGVEQSDVLALAREFGIADLLIEGQKDAGIAAAESNGNRQSLCSFRTEGSNKRDENRKMQDAQVQTEVAGGDTDSPVKKRSCTSTGTQTPTTDSTPFSVMLQPQSIALDKQFCSTSCPVIPSMPSGAPSNGEASLNRSSGSVVPPTLTLASPSEMLTLSISLADGSDSSRPQEDGTYQQSSEFGDKMQVLAEERIQTENGKRNAKKSDNRQEAEQPSQTNRNEMPGEETRKSAEKSHGRANVGMKNLVKMKHMQQMVKTTQISIKVKLRRKRRTEGEEWEVVNMQDTNENPSLLTSLKQDGFNHRGPETDLSNIPHPPSTVQLSPINKPNYHNLQPVPMNFSKSPTTSLSQLPSTQYFTSNQRGCLYATPLIQHHCSVEESEEQIDKLLEDIMIGLNILPTKKSDQFQPGQGGVSTFSQLPVTQTNAGQNQMCEVYQDFGTQSCNSSRDTGIDCRFPAQTQSSCTVLSSVPQETAALIQQQQESSAQCLSSIGSTWQTDEISSQNMPLSKSQECPPAETPTARSVIHPAVFSSGQKLHYSASQDSQDILEFFPMTNGNQTQLMHTLSLPCVDDLRLPKCLSPLKSCTPTTEHQTPLISSLNLGDTVQQQPSLRQRPWLTGNPGSLQFPLHDMSHIKNKNASLSQGKNWCCLSKQRQGRLGLKPQNRGTVTKSASAKTASDSRQKSAKLKSVSRNMRKGDDTGETVAVTPRRRKTKPTNDPQGVFSSLLSADDETKRQITLSVCRVSLSSNNVLAKERQMAFNASNIVSKCAEKQNQPSPVEENLKVKTTRSKTGKTQIRTRTGNVLKKTPELTGDTSEGTSLEAKTVNEEGVRGRKRGWPKIKLEDVPSQSDNPAVVEIKSHNNEKQQQMNSSLLKEDLETMQRCKKRRKDPNPDSGPVPLKKTMIDDGTDNVDDGDANDKIPNRRIVETCKRKPRVTLKEFHKFIKRQQSNRSLSNQNQEKNETVADAENEGVKTRDDAFKESTKETEMNMDITPQPQDRKESETSSVVFSVNKSTDENVSQQGDTDGSKSTETGLFGEIHPVLEGEKTVVFAAQRKQQLKNPDDAGATCESTTVQQSDIDDEGSSHSETHLPQKNKLLSDHNLPTQTPETTNPPPSDAGGTSRNTGSDQETEEEVDVLLCSPVNAPQTTEAGLNNVDMTPEEDEQEEDVIDVTGDETE